MESKDTQLPAEVAKKIHADTNILYDQLDEAARDVDFYEFGLPQVDRQTEPIRNLLTEYATLLHQEQKVLAAYKADHKINSELLDKAIDLLEKIKSRHEGSLLPDRLLYNEIKTFLDGTR